VKDVPRIDTSWVEPHLRAMRRWEYGLVAAFGLDVFIAAHWIVDPIGPVWVQAIAVSINIAAAVFVWDVAKKSEQRRAQMLDLVRRANEFNRIFP
jgi:hypothetical protein